MKLKSMYVSPIFLETDKVQNLINYIKSCEYQSGNSIPSYADIKMLEGLKTRLLEFLPNKGYNYQPTKAEYKTVYFFHTSKELKNNFSAKFVEMANSLIEQGNIVAPCTAVQYVNFKKHTLKTLNYKSKDYQAKKICGIRKNFNNSLLDCYNHSKSNMVFIIDGDYEGVNPKKIRVDKICGVIDFRNKGDVLINPYYKQEKTDKKGLKLESKDYYDHDKINFQFPLSYEEIMAEVSDLPEQNMDVVGDIYFQTRRFFENLNNPNRLNPLYSEVLEDNIIKVVDSINLTQQVIKDFNVNIDNKYNVIEGKKEGKQKDINISEKEAK